MSPCLLRPRGPAGGKLPHPGALKTDRRNLLLSWQEVLEVATTDQPLQVAFWNQRGA